MDLLHEIKTSACDFAYAMCNTCKYIKQMFPITIINKLVV